MESNPIQFLGDLLGYIVGVVSEYAYSLVRSIASGNKEDLLMAVLTLAVVWVALAIVLRLLRLFWSVFKVSITVLILLGVAWSGFFIYQYGPERYQALLSSLAGQFWQAYGSKLRSTLAFYQVFLAPQVGDYINPNAPLDEVIDQVRVTA